MNKSKLSLLSLFVAFLALTFNSQAQIETPAPSQAGTVTSKVGLTEVTINYSRPIAKGRKIFGTGADVLLKNDELWRAGANSGTKIKFSTDVKVGDKDLKAGEYLFLARPSATEWKVIFYSDLSIGGNMSAYDETKAAAIVAVKPGKLTESVTTLTFNITDLTEDGTKANIELAWENTSVKVPLTVSFDDVVMASIEKNTKVNPGNLVAAANYYVQTNRNLDQAIAWFDTYLAVPENAGHFWVIHQKAQAYAKKGDKKNAIATAQNSIEKAKVFEGGDFGYIKRNEDLIASLK